MPVVVNKFLHNISQATLQIRVERTEQDRLECCCTHDVVASTGVLTRDLLLPEKQCYIVPNASYSTMGRDAVRQTLRLMLSTLARRV